MEPFLDLIFLFLFVGGVLAMIHWKLGGGLLSSSSRLLRDAELARWTLREFLHLNSERRIPGKSFIFREQIIRS
ncbi:MAG: hypothetical protein ACFFD9_04200, partial [Candidatus Thorarchaeota archaeon]